MAQKPRTAGEIFGKRPAPRDAGYFGDNLRHLIGLHCANGQLVAEALGVSRQTVSDLTAKARRHPPSLDTLYKAAELFAVDPDKLYREPFWSWAGDYCRDMGEQIESGEFAAVAVADALHDAGLRIMEREHPGRFKQPRKRKGGAK